MPVPHFRVCSAQRSLCDPQQTVLQRFHQLLNGTVYPSKHFLDVKPNIPMLTFAGFFLGTEPLEEVARPYYICPVSSLLGTKPLETKPHHL